MQLLHVPNFVQDSINYLLMYWLIMTTTKIKFIIYVSLDLSFDSCASVSLFLVCFVNNNNNNSTRTLLGFKLAWPCELQCLYKQCLCNNSLIFAVFLMWCWAYCNTRLRTCRSFCLNNNTLRAQIMLCSFIRSLLKSIKQATWIVILV